MVGKAGAAREELKRDNVLVERRARGADKRKAVLAHTLRAAVAKALGQKQLLCCAARLVEDEPAGAAMVLPVPHGERLVAAVALKARLVLLPLGHTSGQHPFGWFVAVVLAWETVSVKEKSNNIKSASQKEVSNKKKKNGKSVAKEYFGGEQILEMKMNSMSTTFGGVTK